MILMHSGSIKELDDQIKHLLHDQINRYAEKALRTIGICYRDYDLDEWQAFSAQHNQWESEED